MELSPNDIRGYEFRSQMRGYDREEVDRFLDQAADALEETKQQNLKLSMEMESLKSQVAGLKQFEDTIKSAAIDARRNADMTVATAKQEAEMIITRAKSEAESIVINRTKEIGEIESQITRLGLTKKSYLSKIRNLIQSHLEMVDEVDSGEVPLQDTDNRITVTESKDVTTETRETVAQQPTPPEEEPEPEEEPSTESQPVEDNLAAELKQAIQDPDLTQTGEQTIDPELAAALESYKRVAARKAAEQQAAQHRPSAPRQDEVVETNRLAEEIPEGFVAKETDVEDDRSTDKVLLAQTEGNPKANDSGGFKKPISPDELASELEEVAVRFEEEIDKAAKN
jgi:cell division initiation protein